MDSDRTGKLICAECALDQPGFYKDALAEDAAVRAAPVVARG
jgi:hypothetical protein